MLIASRDDIVAGLCCAVFMPLRAAMSARYLCVCAQARVACSGPMQVVQLLL